MSKETLAVKFRPHNFGDVVEQSSVRDILQHQLDTNTYKNAYLFSGSHGCGKTSLARIFANELNNGKGSPIELDAASNSSVDDVREIIKQAKTKSLDSEYKVFIIDEAHSLSNQSWQAFLKLIEEPPKFTIIIFCTTDPQKIPKTILSRVQRYTFTKISFDGIVNRLKYVLDQEGITTYDEEAISFIARLSEGGMRDALTSLDKALSYNTNLTIENVVKALGTVDYDIMLELTKALINNNQPKTIEIIENVFNSGVDLKQFVKQLMSYVLDVNKYFISGTFDYIQIPSTYKKSFDEMTDEEVNKTYSLLSTLINLNANLRWETSVKQYVESVLLVNMETF